MKVLYVGDATVHSGFARVTHNICDALHSAGQTVDLLGLHYFGDPHNYPYNIYPCRSPHKGGRDGMGISRLPSLMMQLEPDLVVIQVDPWQVPAYLESITFHTNPFPNYRLPSIVGHLAVDSKNQRGAVLNTQSARVGLDHVVGWTQFAVDELTKGGYEGDTSVVPLGVNNTKFRPYPDALKKILRKESLPDDVVEDTFVVGVVGRNQPRKRLDLSLEYFAEWISDCGVDNAYLYMHVAPTGDTGFDIRSLCNYYGLAGKVGIRVGGIGYGVGDRDMCAVYNSFDVLLNTGQGEGWGLPVLEAMACGIPCVVPDWSGLGDWAKGIAWTVPCSSVAMTAPVDGDLYTVGGIPDKDAVIQALDSLYRTSIAGNHMTYSGLQLASKLTEENSSNLFIDVLISIMESDKTNREQVDDNESTQQAA